MLALLKGNGRVDFLKKLCKRLQLEYTNWVELDTPDEIEDYVSVVFSSVAADFFSKDAGVQLGPSYEEAARRRMELL